MPLRRLRLLIALTLTPLAAGAQTAGQVPEAAAEVIATEQRFEADAAQGIGAAFLAYAAPTGVMFLPDPVVVADNPAAVDWPGRLLWRPAFVVASANRDLFASTGPAAYEAGGKRAANIFLTIWQRQPDGSLRFILDRGVPQKVDSHAGSSAPVLVLTGTRSVTQTDVARLEADFARAARTDLRRALLARLHPDGRVLRPGVLPIPASAWRMATAPVAVDYSLIAGGVASSGDLAWAYGRATWAEGGASVGGHFVRVWLRTRAGWRIAIDELSPRR